MPCFPPRYPNISCELLTSDVGQINDRLGEDESLLMKLYGFLQNEPPLNPLLASFFSKVLSILIGRKPEQVSLCSGDVYWYLTIGGHFCYMYLHQGISQLLHNRLTVIILHNHWVTVMFTSRREKCVITN